MSVNPLPCCTVLSVSYAGFIGIVSYYFLKFRHEKKWTKKRKSVIAILFTLIMIPPVLVAGAMYSVSANAIDIKRNYRTEQERNAIDISEHYDYGTVIKSKNWGFIPNPTQIDAKAIEDAKSQVTGNQKLGLITAHMYYRAEVQPVDRLKCNFTTDNIAIEKGNLTPLLVTNDSSRSSWMILFAIVDNGSMKGFTYSKEIHTSGEIDINGSYLVDMTLNTPYNGGDRTLKQSVFIDQDGKVQFFVIWPGSRKIA